MSIHSVPTHRQQTKSRPHNSVAWQKASAAWIQQYPLCVLCVCRGEYNRGVSDMSVSTQRNLIVDHITPHRGDMDLFWDQNNWQTLCRCPCHDVEKSRHEHKGRTAEQWFAMLAKESARHDVQADASRLMPKSVVDGIGQAGGGVWGSNARNPWP